MYYENQYDTNKTIEQELVQQKMNTADKSIVKLLSEILKTNKEILRVLQNEFDPKPKVIVGEDGTKCTENENANCYSMPQFTKEAKLPVFANFFKDPSIQNAANVVMWTDKHIYEIRKRGALQTQAIMHFGDQITPMNGLSRVGYQDSSDMYGKFETQYKANIVLNTLKQNKFHLQFYWGDDFAQNTLMLSKLSQLVKYYELYGEIPLTVYFKSANAKAQIERVFQVLDNRESLRGIYNKVGFKIIPQEQYISRGIKNFPSFAIYDEKNNGLQILISGPSDIGSITKSIERFLEFNGYLRADQFSDEKIAGEGSPLNNIKATNVFGLSDNEKKEIGLEK